LGTSRGGPGLEISAGLKFLSITEEKIIHRDISVKQQIIYKITTNTTCILKRKQQQQQQQQQTNKLENFY
jgi:hypothetical protein